jgi:hypothetical protein
MKTMENEIAGMLGAYIGRRQVNNKLSPELEQKIKVANRQWGKAKDSILDVYRQARKDGWTPVEAAKLCREKLTIFSPRTIRGILPNEAKNQQMKREPKPVGSRKTETQLQNAESLPQNVVTAEQKQEEASEQQSSHKPDVTVEQSETVEVEQERRALQLHYKDARQEEEEQYNSPISVKQEQKHDEAVDQQYHHMRSLIELLSGVDYIKEKDGNLVLVEKTKEYRFKLIKQLSDLDVKTIYAYGRALAMILNDYMKQLDDELDVRQAKEKLVSE